MPFAVLACAALALAAGCAMTGTVEARKPFDHAFEVGEAPLVLVETFNGRITVQSGADGVVEARVTARGSGTSLADAERDLANVEVTFDQSRGRLTITARRSDRPISPGNSGADVEVTVPPSSSLELRTSNGRIESANVMGSILARTSNGAITARGGENVDLDTSNGPVTLKDARGRLDLRTSNGTIDIVSAVDALVEAQTSNDALSFSGSLADGAHLFHTSNGDLTLSLPGDTRFRIDGSTSNGRVVTDFPLAVGDATLDGRVGFFPPVSIRAETSNGDLMVRALLP